MASTVTATSVVARLQTSALASSCTPSGSPSSHKRAAAISGSKAFFSSSPLPFKHLSLQAGSSKCKRSNGLRVEASVDVSVGSTTASLDDKIEEYRKCKEALWTLIKFRHCHPIIIRMAWHDSGTFDSTVESWPERGGANGSLRFKMELDHGANAGLLVAYNLLKPIKAEFPNVTWADLFQLASATAIELAGGPKIELRYGRVDTESDAQCPPSGRLPDADPKTITPAQHLRNVFYRMTFDDKDIVALSGAHTMGRVRQDRSGFGVKETKYTKDGPGIKGGQSWTPDWLQFNNNYFVEVKEKRDNDLVILPTDAALFEDEGFSTYALKYAEDVDAFFADYAVAHKKLSELGAKWDPEGGFTL